MTLAFGLLIAGIGLSPLLLISDSAIVQGFLSAYIAITLLITLISIPPGEAVFSGRILRPAAGLAVIPLIWMVLQVLPLPFSGIEHPIWESARTTLAESLWGSITIDPGMTLVVIARYMAALGICVVASALCVDRQRAEILLLALAGVTTLLALLAIVHNAGGFVFLGELSSVGPRASIAASSVLGVSLTAACMLLALERYETRHGKRDFSFRYFFCIGVGTCIGFLLCWMNILLFASAPVMTAAFCGFGTFLLIVCFRRIGLGVRAGLCLTAAAAIIPLSVIIPGIWTNKTNLSILFAAEAPATLTALTQRILNDTSWLGSGAGTFQALLSIYRDPESAGLTSDAPTFAASLLIGMGPVALWLAVAGALIAFSWLLKGALSRGRDSFFVAAAASCTLSLLIEAFVDGGLSTTIVVVIAASVLGLGIAQRTSRTVR